MLRFPSGLTQSAAFALAGFCAFTLTSPAQAQPIQTACPKAVLMDAETRAFLFERNADDVLSPASIAKVMTAEVLFGQLKAGKITLDDTFPISEKAWKQGGAASRGSTMFAQLNSRVRVEDLIRGMVIMSGNDAAIAIAEGVAGAEEAFAQMMTRRARELGLKDSTFTNAWGRSDVGQKMSVRDMARLGAHVQKTYPEYYRYFGEKDFTWNKIQQPNRNPLLAMNIGADGMKTGNVDDSGYAILGTASDGERRLFVALNGCKTASDRTDDARKLLTWGFRSFEQKALFNEGEIVGGAKVYGGARGEAPLVADGPIKVFLQRGSVERLTAQIVYEGPIPAPVTKGQQIAKLRVMRGQTLALETPLRAAEDVDVGALPQRALDAALELVSGLFRKYVLKK